MHETAMVASIMRILEEEARRHHVSRITDVALSVGLFTAVEVQALRSCFELLAEGTIAGGAELHVTIVPAQGKCLDCGCEFPIASPRARCRQCGGIRLECSGGHEFCITGIDAG